MKKSVIAMLLCVLMLASLFPVEAIAAELDNGAEEYNETVTPPEEEVTVEPAEKPVYVEAPVAEEPVIEEPVTEEPVAEEPVVEVPVVEEPVIVEPLPADETGENEESDTEETPCVVVFRCEPETAEITVYSREELERAEREQEEPQPIKPEADESYLLWPGAYVYYATAEGYEAVEKQPFVVEIRESEKTVVVSLTKPEITIQEPANFDEKSVDFPRFVNSANNKEYILIENGQLSINCTSIAKSIVETAVSHLGQGYKSGAESNGNYDCIGLVRTSYNAVGITLPRRGTGNGSPNWADDGIVSDVTGEGNSPYPGDILCWYKNTSNKTGQPDHVAIYTGWIKVIDGTNYAGYSVDSEGYLVRGGRRVDCINALNSKVGVIFMNAQYGSGLGLYTDIWRAKSISSHNTLDVNGNMDGAEQDNLSNYGTFDVKIKRPGEDWFQWTDDLNDFYESLPVGTEYRIEDIRAKNGYYYVGESSYSGTLQYAPVKIVLNFVSGLDIKISGVKKPEGDLPLNKSFGLAGIISSASNLSEVSVRIINTSTGVADQKFSYSTNPNSRTYDIKNDGADKALKFANLPKGNYRYIVSATNSSVSMLLVESYFTVGGGSSDPFLQFSDYGYNPDGSTFIPGEYRIKDGHTAYFREYPYEDAYSLPGVTSNNKTIHVSGCVKNSYGNIWYRITNPNTGENWYCFSDHLVFVSTTISTEYQHYDDPLEFVSAPATYTVSYNANGGTGAPGNQTKTQGTALTLSATVPTRTGYSFKGWSTSSGGGAQYQPGGSYTTDAGVTLYAVWEVKYYTFDLNGYLDGITLGNLGVYGSCDIYVNGLLFVQDVNEYCAEWPYGTTYEFRNIRPAEGYSYDGISNIAYDEYIAGDRSGTITGNTSVRLAFHTCPISVNESPEPAVFSGHTYYYFSTPVTWYDAKVLCENLGGHLVTVTSEEETNFLINLVKERFKEESGCYIWLGASDRDSEGNWQWITGESFSYTKWFSGEPSNGVWNEEGSENYAHFYTWQGDWNDTQGCGKMPFVCEIDSASYTLNFDANGGTGNMPAVTAEFDELITCPHNSFAMKGYSFVGWYFRRDTDGYWYTGDGRGFVSDEVITSDSLEKVLYKDGAEFWIGYGGSTVYSFVAVWEPIVSRLPGDCNVDGKVNGMDLVRLRRHLVGDNVKIDLSNADVTGDGKVTGMDLVRLRRYLVGDNVVLK